MSKALDLVKGLAIVSDNHHHHTSTEMAAPDLVKSGNPPAGFHPIPGGKQGGYTNGKVGQSRRYWYPHDADVEAAGNHHRAEAGRLKMEHRGRMTASGYPKDKAAKKELENHHHAAFAAQDGDYRVGAAPKKKRAPKKPAASAVEQAKDLGQKYAATKPGSAPRARIAKKRDALIQAAGDMDAQMDVHNAFHRASQKAIFDRNKVEADKVMAGTKKSDTPSAPITGYRMGSVNYIEAPAYELPEGGGTRRPGMHAATLAQPPVIDTGTDPYVTELARVSGRLVHPNHGILAHVHGITTNDKV